MATVAGASKRQIGMLFDICREHKIEIVFNFCCKITKSNLFHRQCSAPLCGPSCEEKGPHKQVFNTLARSSDLSILYPISTCDLFNKHFPGVLSALQIWSWGKVVQGREPLVADHSTSSYSPFF